MPMFAQWYTLVVCVHKMFLLHIYIPPLSSTSHVCDTPTPASLWRQKASIIDGPRHTGGISGSVRQRCMYMHIMQYCMLVIEHAINLAQCKHACTKTQHTLLHVQQCTTHNNRCRRTCVACSHRQTLKTRTWWCRYLLVSTLPVRVARKVEQRELTGGRAWGGPLNTCK